MLAAKASIDEPGSEMSAPSSDFAATSPTFLSMADQPLSGQAEASERPAPMNSRRFMRATPQCSRARSWSDFRRHVRVQAEQVHRIIFGFKRAQARKVRPVIVVNHGCGRVRIRKIRIETTGEVVDPFPAAAQIGEMTGV